MNDEFEKKHQRYLSEQRWEKLAELLEEAIETTDDLEPRLELYDELGSIAVDHLKDPDKAFFAWEAIMNVRKDDAITADFCEQILLISPGYEPAIRRLEPIYGLGTEDQLRMLASHFLDAAESNDAKADDAFMRYRRQAATIFEQQLDQPDAAFLVLISALREDTYQTGLLDELDRLARLTGQYGELADQTLSFITQLPAGPSVARLQKRIGFWLLAVERDEEAIEHLNAAAAYFPHDSELSDTIDLILKNRGDWDVLVHHAKQRMMEAIDEPQRTRLSGEFQQVLKEAIVDSKETNQTKFLWELGTHLAEQGELAQATRKWEDALNIDPDYVPAALSLIDVYVPASAWEKAAPLLENIVRNAKGTTTFPPEQWAQLTARYADICERLGNRKLALEMYRESYQTNGAIRVVVERYAALSFEAETWETANRLYTKLIIEHGTKLSREELADAQAHLGTAKYRDGYPEEASEWLARAEMVLPEHPLVVSGLIDVARASGSVEEQIRALDKSIAVTADPGTKFKLLNEVAELWQQVGRADMATRAFEGALKIEPDSLIVLRKLLGLFQQAKKWRSAIEVLRRINAHETSKEKRASTTYTMAIIARDEVRDPVQAVALFEEALDDDPSMTKAFEAIDRILTENRAWIELERSYRKMLLRMKSALVSESEKEDLNYLLFKGLGEIYRTRLGRFQEALDAFETALSIRPDDDELRLIVAELYARSGLNLSGAVNQFFTVLEKRPDDWTTVTRLYQALYQQKHFDHAWCIAGVLQATGNADWDTSEYYSQYLGQNVKLASGTLYPELMERVYHRDMDRTVSSIMAFVALSVRGMFARSAKDYGVHEKKNLYDFSQPRRFGQVYNYVAKTVAIQPTPQVYARMDHPLGMRAMQTEPPAVLVGSDIVDSQSGRVLVFDLAKLLAGMRPELYLAHCGLAAENLNLFWQSAIDFGTGQKPKAGKEGAAIIKRFKALQPAHRVQLQTLIQSFVNTGAPMPNFERWMSAAEHTSSRVGLLLANDVTVATTFIRGRADIVSYASVNERVMDLHSWAMSPDHAGVRRELGLAIH